MAGLGLNMSKSPSSQPRCSGTVDIEWIDSPYGKETVESLLLLKLRRFLLSRLKMPSPCLLGTAIGALMPRISSSRMRSSSFRFLLERRRTGNVSYALRLDLTVAGRD